MSDTITVRLPGKLQKELAAVAKSGKVSKSTVIRDAIVRYIAVSRFERLRRQVLPFAEAQGLLTDEDVFKTIS